jgi:hypothetical protein
MNYSPEVMKNMGEWVSKQTTILEKEMIEAKGKEMQQEIDREVLWGMLQGMGWCRVMLPRLVDNNHAIDITYWLEENCKKAFERNGRDFLFEDSKDANWFKLRWGTV